MTYIRYMNEERRLKAMENLRQRRTDGMDLWHAYRDNEPEIMRVAIEGGARADAIARPRLFRTVLHETAADGPEDLFPEVLATCRNPDAKDRDGWTPLMVATRAGYREKTILLLEAGCKTSTKSRGGDQAIHHVHHMHEDDQADVLRSFVRAGAALDIKDYSGRTVLHRIAETDNVEAAEVLISAGAMTRIRVDPHVGEIGGMRASEIAGASGQMGMQAYLADEEERERLYGKHKRQPGVIEPWRVQQRVHELPVKSRAADRER